MVKLRKIDSSDLEDDILEFAPIECMDCNFNGHIPNLHYLVEPYYDYEEMLKLLPEDQVHQQLEDRHFEVEKLLKKLGFKSFSEMTSELGDIVSVSKCPKCGSENIFEDF